MKIPRQVKIVIVLLLTFAITSCCRKTDNPTVILRLPTLEDYTWFLYPTGDRIFTNQFGSTDTIVATISSQIHGLEKTYGSVSSDVPKPTECDVFYRRGYLSEKFQLKTDTGLHQVASIRSYQSFFYQYSSTNTTVDLTFTPDHSVVYGCGFNVGDHQRLLYLFDTAMTINANNYDDVYLIDSITYYPSQPKVFDKVYYSKSTGIIKYVKPDGTIWELIN